MQCTQKGPAMFGLEITVRVKPDKRQEFMQAFELLTRRESQPSGCLTQSLFQKVGEPNVFLWFECWSASELLEVYMQTDRFRTLLGAIRVLGALEELWRVDIKPLTDKRSGAAL